MFSFSMGFWGFGALRQARIDALEEAASHVEAKHGYGIALQIAAEIRTLKVDK